MLADWGQLLAPSEHPLYPDPELSPLHTSMSPHNRPLKVASDLSREMGKPAQSLPASQRHRGTQAAF